MKRCCVVVAEEGLCLAARVGNAVPGVSGGSACQRRGPRAHKPWQQSGPAGSPCLAVGSLWPFEGTERQPWCKSWQNPCPCSQLICSLGRGPNELIILRNWIWPVGQKLDKFLYRRKMRVHLVRELELVEMSLWHPKLGWRCCATSLHPWGQLHCRKQGTGVSQGCVRLWHRRAEGLFLQK